MCFGIRLAISNVNTNVIIIKPRWLLLSKCIKLAIIKTIDQFTCESLQDHYLSTSISTPMSQSITEVLRDCYYK